MSKHAAEFDYLPQDSEMVRILRSTEWSSTPLGEPSTWPDLLRVQLNTCFESAFPIAIWWGPELLQFYNDGYRPILGALKHPHAFGRPAVETWPDIWPTIGTMVEQVVEQGIAVKGEDMPLVLERNGYPEECHFTFSYSPIRDGSGQIKGMFTAAVETSERVRAERRLAFQLRLADQFRGVAETDDITAIATELLCQHLKVARAYYAEIDDKAGTFSIAKQWTDNPDFPQLPTHGNIVEFGPYLLKTLRQGRPVVVEDVGVDPHFIDFADAYKALAIQSIVIVPLIRHGHLRGNLNVAHIVSRKWTEDEVSIIADVADRTWDALERARSEEALRISNRRKDEFLAMLSHELRNPLAPIRTAAELLRMVAHGDPMVCKASEVISRQTTHMTSLIDDLLDASRVMRGLVELNKERVNFQSILDDVVEQSKPLISLKKQNLCVRNVVPTQTLT